jgi:hypothetical protein
VALESRYDEQQTQEGKAARGKEDIPVGRIMVRVSRTGPREE